MYAHPLEAYAGGGGDYPYVFHSDKVTEILAAKSNHRESAFHVMLQQHDMCQRTNKLDI